jgi:hypothetical protein
MLKYGHIFKRLPISLECFEWQRAALMLAQFVLNEGPSTAFDAFQLLFDGLLMIFKGDRNGLFWVIDLLHLKKHIVHCMLRLWWEDWKTIHSECFLSDVAHYRYCVLYRLMCQTIKNRDFHMVSEEATIPFLLLCYYKHPINKHIVLFVLWNVALSYWKKLQVCL